jgi:hypothetical protein
MGLMVISISYLLPPPVRAWKYSGGWAHPFEYIATDASFAAINCAIRIPSTGSAGAMSIVPRQTATAAAVIVSVFFE